MATLPFVTLAHFEHVSASPARDLLRELVELTWRHKPIIYSSPQPR